MDLFRTIHIIQIGIHTFYLIYHHRAISTINLIALCHVNKMSRVICLSIRYVFFRITAFFFIFTFIYYSVCPALYGDMMHPRFHIHAEQNLRTIIRPCPLLKLSMNTASRIHRFHWQSPITAVAYITTAENKLHKASNRYSYIHYLLYTILAARSSAVFLSMRSSTSLSPNSIAVPTPLLVTTLPSTTTESVLWLFEKSCPSHPG